MSIFLNIFISLGLHAFVTYEVFLGVCVSRVF